MEPKAIDMAVAFDMDTEGPGMDVHYDITLFALLLLLFVVAVLGYVGIRMWRSRRLLATSRPVPPSSRVLPLPSISVRFQLVRELAWLVVPFIVVGSFGVMAEPREFLPGWGLSTTVIAPPLAAAPPKAAVSVTVSNSGPNVSASGSGTRPAWVDIPRKSEEDSEWIVLTSSQYSTREEAEQELRAATVKLLEEDLKHIQSGPFRPKHWRPEPEAVVTHAVAQRHDDVTERDFGSFTHPMHSVSWQVELSPRVRTEFIPVWRRELISFRILLVAGVASLFAMAASASVLYFRIDALTLGQSRGRLKLLATGATALWLVLVVGLFSQGYLW